ncbi:MAG: hypothetical protein ACAI44_13890 [Candidatus Sericytochromatia bacterium]
MKKISKSFPGKVQRLDVSQEKPFSHARFDTAKTKAPENNLEFIDKEYEFVPGALGAIKGHLTTIGQIVLFFLKPF